MIEKDDQPPFNPPATGTNITNEGIPATGLPDNAHRPGITNPVQVTNTAPTDSVPAPVPLVAKRLNDQGQPLIESEPAERQKTAKQTPAQATHGASRR